MSRCPAMVGAYAYGSVGSAPGRLCESFDEGKCGICDFAPAAVDGEGMSTILDLDNLGDAWVVLLLLVGGGGDRRWQVWSCSPAMIRPRSGLSVSTFASVHGLRFAVTTWNSGFPAVGTE
jgi:hypothetical protein